MVKTEYVTLYYGIRIAEDVEAEDDLESGKFSDEEDMKLVQTDRVKARFTNRNYLVSEPQLRMFLPHNTRIGTDWRVKRDKTGTIYVVSDVTQSNLAGSDLIVDLRE